MKKKLALILAGTAMAAMVLAGCGEKNNASGEDVKTAESVEDKKTFTVGFDAEYPPYGYMDENGEYTGFDLELAEAVCKLEGWELVKNHLREMSILDHPSEETFDSIQPCMGSGKPVVLHADEGFKVIKKEELRKCCDCPNPCI